MQIMVPDRTVGLIIGRGGETIRDLQERSGCHVNIVGEQKSVNGLRPVNLIGSREAAAKAKDLIMEIVESDSKSLASKDRAPAQRDSGRDGGYGGGGEKINDSIFVPSEAVGMIIGKGGETIKDIQSTTGCKVNVSPSSGPGEVEREIGLVGTRDAIERAKRAIEDKVEAVVSFILPSRVVYNLQSIATEKWHWWRSKQSPPAT
jgi:far upstream element-binding protein